MLLALEILVTFERPCADLPRSEQTSAETRSCKRIVSELNEKSATIAEDVAEFIRARVPNSSRIDVSISFKTGSIEAIVELLISNLGDSLDWLSAVGGSIGFIEYLSKLTRMAVKNAVATAVPDDLSGFSTKSEIVKQPSTDTHVHAVPAGVTPWISVTNQQTLPPSSASGQGASWSVQLWIVALGAITLLNTILVVGLAAMILKS